MYYFCSPIKQWELGIINSLQYIMKSFFSILSLFLICSLTAQESTNDVLFTVDGDAVKSSEFVRVYKKNLDLVQDESQKDVDNYLDLFINYKLKVKEAKRLGLDKDKSYLREFGNYKSQLTKGYMTDNEVTDKLVKEAYQRSIQDVKASHVLVRINESETDTTEVYNKILELRQRVLDEGYEAVQKDVHDGKTIFAEDLGWFSAFKMVYPFETAAYNTEKGEVSQPFRTRFGYHFLKVWDKRESLGEVTVAHIMLANNQKDTTIDLEQRINQIYGKIQQGEKFESLAKQFSDDKSSASKGGVLNPFSGGQLSSQEFEDVSFSLENNGDVSEPFKTDYGWHIVKLIGKKGIQPFEAMESELQNKVRRDSRSKLIQSAMTAKLKNQYGIQDNTPALNYFETIITDDFFKRAWKVPADLDADKIFFKIKDSTITYKDFANHIYSAQRNYSNRPTSPGIVVQNEYEAFLEKALSSYKKEHLAEENEEFAHVLNEYRDGLLLFDLMEQEVWNKASKDSSGLEEFYKKNKSKYQWKRRAEGTLFSGPTKKDILKVRELLKNTDSSEVVVNIIAKGELNGVIPTKSTFDSENRMIPENLKLKKGLSKVFKHNDAFHVLNVKNILPSGQKTLKEARGQVVSDYQVQLEDEWMQTLQKRYNVEVNQEALEQVKSKLNN